MSKTKIDGSKFISDLHKISSMLNHHIDNVSINYVKIDSATFKDCLFTKVDFCSVGFFNVEFVNCEFKDCVFDGNSLSHTNFKSCILTSGEFKNNTVKYGFIRDTDFLYCYQENNQINYTSVTDSPGWKGQQGTRATESCTHEWVETAGFTSIFVDCKKCGEKRA
jgi:uncharacterized protein YjbI with pentapeptide repeats